MGTKRNKGRNVNGILLLDKPTGLTSNAALQEVKRLFYAKKAGHTGSLDPLASGMLPICFGEATKFSQFLLDADKTYRVIGKLGVKTTTGDAEGEVISERDSGNVTQEKIEALLPQFRGEIEQIPSMYSALKHNGQPLYKLARQGITIEREARKINIYSLELLGFKNSLIELEISCSKGTYVRTLIEDIGDALGCGAHVIALRRLTVGDFTEEQMITMEQLKEIREIKKESLDTLLLPISNIIQHCQELKLSEAAAYYLQQGQAIISPHAPAEGLVKLVMKDGRFLGVGEIAADGKVIPKRLMQSKI